jgi:hypothetical protein
LALTLAADDRWPRGSGSSCRTLGPERKLEVRRFARPSFVRGTAASGDEERGPVVAQVVRSAQSDRGAFVSRGIHETRRGCKATPGKSRRAWDVSLIRPENRTSARFPGPNCLGLALHFPDLSRKSLRRLNGHFALPSYFPAVHPPPDPQRHHQLSTQIRQLAPRPPGQRTRPALIHFFAATVLSASRFTCRTSSASVDWRGRFVAVTFPRPCNAPRPDARRTVCLIATGKSALPRSHTFFTFEVVEMVCSSPKLLPISGARLEVCWAKSQPATRKTGASSLSSL